MHKKLKQQGFTLVELLITVSIFGVILYMIGPTISAAFTFFDAAKRQEVVMNNQRIAGGIMSYARNSNNGLLPAPYTGGNINSGIYNPADVSPPGLALTMELRNTGVPIAFLNSDSAIVKNVKVYRRLSGLVYTAPIYFTTGSLITINYDIGAIVQTQCAQGSACNSGTPGDSPVLTAANLATWDAAGQDFGAVVFSTLPLQKEMLRMTTGRLNKLSDKLASEFYTRQRLSAANSPTNFFPLPSNGGAPNFIGRNPVTNMGCHNGWYSLDAGNVNILAQIGMDSAEFGVTAWGGPVEYCQDYERDAVGPANAGQAPHYAALRINRNLSSAAAPSGVEAANVVVTF